MVHPFAAFLSSPPESPFHSPALLFTRLHWVETSVDLDGRPHRVGLMLAEDTTGNLFDNLNADVDAWAQKTAPQSYPPIQGRGNQSRFTTALTRLMERL